MLAGRVDGYAQFPGKSWRVGTGRNALSLGRTLINAGCLLDGTEGHRGQGVSGLFVLAGRVDGYAQLPGKSWRVGTGRSAISLGRELINDGFHWRCTG